MWYLIKEVDLHINSQLSRSSRRHRKDEVPTRLIVHIDPGQDEKIASIPEVDWNEQSVRILDWSGRGVTINPPTSIPWNKNRVHVVPVLILISGNRMLLFILARQRLFVAKIRKATFRTTNWNLIK